MMKGRVIEWTERRINFLYDMEKQIWDEQIYNVKKNINYTNMFHVKRVYSEMN